MKKILLPILFLILAACSSSQVAVTRSAQVTVTSPPPAATPIPMPTLHPQFVKLQSQIASSGERFTLLSDGTIEQSTSEGTITVPGLSVDKNGAITLQGESLKVIINPADVSFDDTKGVNVKGYTLDEETGKWGVMGTSLSIENLDAKKWGNYSLIENPDGYYEMKDVQGNLIPEVKFFRDGTAELTHGINGKTENLWIALQAVHVVGGKLIVGLWDYNTKNKTWSDINTKSAADMVKSVETGEEDPYKLIILRGHANEKQMIETMFLARDESMSQEDMRAEFDDITVEYNFQEYNTSEDFDRLVVPAKWQLDNFSREVKAESGMYKLRPYSKDKNSGFEGKLAAIRPMQVGLKEGYFGVEIDSLTLDKKWEFQSLETHVPVIMINPDGSFMAGTSIVSADRLSRLANLTEKNRGDILFALITNKAIGQYWYGDIMISSPSSRNFGTEVNQSTLANFNMPKLDHDEKYTSRLPEEFSGVIFFLGGSYFQNH